ncbi:lysozyme, partial [Salmonella enterica]|nr:lysozyme [Salmonella enterica]EGV6796500.1 lysozyme [Salmonella enterica]EIG0594466.1 lysozyme [Salmonella enterica]EJI6732442.1 lysozyme [Salmonella enterica]ELE1361499.1 lysozyme [Salmonella enterica]
DGNPVVSGMTITAEKSSELLKEDLQWVEDAISSLVRVPLNQNQYDALCSLIFNIGKSAFAGSTVLRQLNLKNYQAAADAFLLWKKAGKDPDILLPRRRRERALFLS